MCWPRVGSRRANPSQSSGELENIVYAMRGVSREIQLRQIGHFLKAGKEFGTGVAKGFGVAESTLRALVAA